MENLNEGFLNQLFIEARTINKFQDKEVSDETLKQLYDLVKMGPTAFNAQPARFTFIKSRSAKERLKPYLMAGNVEKTMNAPVTVIVSTDTKFYDLLPKTFPVADVRGIFTNNKDMAFLTGFRNSSLAGGYLITAARALGLDVGAMSGFNNAGVDKEFYFGTSIESNFLINLGYKESSENNSRLPRLEFNETSEIL